MLPARRRELLAPREAVQIERRNTGLVEHARPFIGDTVPACKASPTMHEHDYWLLGSGFGQTQMPREHDSGAFRPLQKFLRTRARRFNCDHLLRHELRVCGCGNG